MTTNRRLLALILIALLVRLPIFLAGSWYDENFSLVLTRLPLDRLLAAVAGDVHPPLYYLVQWMLAQVLGSSLLIIRLPALLCSLGTLALLPALYTRLGLPAPVQTAALVIYALAPMQIHYGTEGRMYALLQLLVVLGAWAVLAKRWDLVYLAVSGLAWTHNWGLFYGLCLGLLALPGLRRADWLPAGLAFGLAAFTWLPWAVRLVWQMQAISGNYWILRVSLGQVLYALHELVWTITLAVVPGLLGTALWYLAGLWTARRFPSAWRLYLLAFGPLAVGVIVSLVYQPVVVYRFLIGSSPFIYALLAAPTVWIWNGLTRRLNLPQALLAAIVLLPMLVMSYRQLYEPGQLRGVAWHNSPAPAWVDQVRPGDRLVANTDGPVIDFRARFPAYHVDLLQSCRPALGSLTDATRAALGYAPLPSLPAGRVWVIYSDSAITAACEQAQYAALLSQARLVWSDPLNNQFIQNSVWLIENK